MEDLTFIFRDMTFQPTSLAYSVRMRTIIILFDLIL